NPRRRGSAAAQLLSGKDSLRTNKAAPASGETPRAALSCVTHHAPDDRSLALRASRNIVDILVPSLAIEKPVENTIQNVEALVELGHARGERHHAFDHLVLGAASLDDEALAE